jgi:NAD(P)-dependent dehydrogenase (short-subunit alcohol dehydrogenase family)
MTNLRILDGRCVLVTGATGYLGRAMCHSIGEAGATVLVNSRDKKRASEFVDYLQDIGLSAEPAVFDVTDTEAVRNWVDLRCNEPLHGLVNNAYSGEGGTLLTSEDKEWTESYKIAVVAAQRLIRSLVPSLILAREEFGDAAIVNISSMYGSVSPDLRVYSTLKGSNPPFYGASKAALEQLTKYSACELGSKNIRVNAVAPGPFPEPTIGASDPDFVTKLAERVPLQRIGSAEEIGGPVVFLLSPAASYITGAVLPVDGGWTSW